MESLKDWTFEVSSEMLNETIYNVLMEILRKYCLENKIKYEKFKKYKLVDWKSIEDITKIVANIIWQSLIKAILQFYSWVKEIFNETFEERWYYYILKDENFYLNEEKYKLFKEYKISQAERYLKNWIKKYISDIIREKLYWIKTNLDKWLEIQEDNLDNENNSNINIKNKEFDDKLENDLEKDLESEEIIDEDEWLELNWLDNNEKNDNEIEKIKWNKWNINQNIWVKSILDRAKNYKEKWWIKNIILAKLEKEIYKFRTMSIADLNNKNK